MTDEAAIRATVLDYFEGYLARDRSRLERAFALNVANMMGIETDKAGRTEVFSVPMHTLIERWTSPDRPEAEFGPGRILSLDRFGEAGATVLFDFGGQFLDSLQLAKRDGDWKIVNKFFVLP